MEHDTKARISISLGESRFEIEGDSEFVSAQVERFEDLIRSALASVDEKSNKLAEPNAHAIPTPTAQSAVSLAEFENLFAIADGKIQVLKTIPGNSTSEKMVAAALLMAFANELNGQTSTTFESIRLLCKSHACLDSGNFSKSLKAEKALFIYSGSPKSQTVTLTVPGKKHADQLARSLNAS